jgi:hypothetical protein
MADELACQQKSMMNTPYTQQYPKFTHLKINDIIVTRDSEKWLQDYASRIPIQQYYFDKHGWPMTTFESIHWTAQQVVLHGYDANDQRRVLKFVHGWLPTHDRLYREKQATSQRCSNNTHMFNCKHTSQQNIRESMLERIRKEIQCYSRKELLMAILEGITMGLNDATWKAEALQRSRQILSD